MVYYAQKKYDKAKSYYESALEINMKVYGDVHPKVAENYYNIGLVCFNQNDYGASLTYYKKAYEIYKEIYGEEGQDTEDVRQIIDFISEKMNNN